MGASLSTLFRGNLVSIRLDSKNSDSVGEKRISKTFSYNKKNLSLFTEAVISSNVETNTYIHHPPTPIIADSTAWHRVDSKCHEALNEHGYYWWKTSGYALASLLEKAGYSYAAQSRSLEFFARSIAPRLGVANKPGADRWKSFMTDDHNPIELSWDWHTGHKAPTIRFSVEPIGLKAGTSQDPRNLEIAGEFTKMITEDLPATNMQWFNHFESYFSLGTERHSPLGHQTSVFWAFDLDEKSVIGKAYFFPEYRACATQKTNLQVIAEAIKAAPACKAEELGALHMFQAYAHEYVADPRDPLEMDMLAIDLVEPLQSRFKIYFRTRETSFQSVRDAMTLGGRIMNKEMDLGLQNLRTLWDGLFAQHDVSDDTSLPASTHRTAGLLFNVEFRLGSNTPKVKIYIPVRHYAQNDWQIINAVNDYMTGAKTCTDGVVQPRKGQTASAYSNAMSDIFNGKQLLRSEKGRQTYVGCSIQPGGQLRVVSYINPK